MSDSSFKLLPQFQKHKCIHFKRKLLLDPGPMVFSFNRLLKFGDPKFELVKYRPGVNMFKGQ